MYSILNSRGYGMTERIRKCSDGEEYEITEIREPKAFGFFVSTVYKPPIFSFLYPASNGENFLFFIFVV